MLMSSSINLNLYQKLSILPVRLTSLRSLQSNPLSLTLKSPLASRLHIVATSGYPYYMMNARLRFSKSAAFNPD